MASVHGGMADLTPAQKQKLTVEYEAIDSTCTKERGQLLLELARKWRVPVQSIQGLMKRRRKAVKQRRAN